MVTCQPVVDQGLMRIFGTTPNGNAVVTREQAGVNPVLLRGGARVVTTGGVALDDTEAPLGVPLTYRVAMANLVGIDRIFQQNLMPTPTFLHGVQGWTAGTGRTLSVVADAAAHSAAGVGSITGNVGGVAPSAPPTLVGHVDSAVFEAASYTLTPPTTGGAAIATNDWMVLFHQQLSSIAAPATPAGWTLLTDSTSGTVREIAWKRKRLAGDAGYTVAAPSGAQSVATLLWVRSAIDEIWASGVANPQFLGTTDVLVSARTTSLRPYLAVYAFSGDTGTAIAAPVSGNLTGGATFQYTRNSGTLPRTMTIATVSSTESGQTPVETLQYGGALQGGFASVVAFQVANTITDRVVAKAKTTALPATTRPYLLTGRFRFTSAGLKLWSDVKAAGTWQNLKDNNASWLAVRGLSSTIPADYLQLFVTIVNPTDQTDYIAPVQVLAAGEQKVNQWTDFSVLFNAPPGGIPATAEVRLSHGASLKQYAVQWFLDEFGITPGDQRLHNTLYWFDGDTALPPDPTSYAWPGWTATSSDAAIAWTGTVGNSISVFNGPSAMSAVTSCQLDASATALLLPCEPVLISDPVNVTLTTWVGLIHIDALVHPSKQTIHQIINRAAAVAISQVRGWETGQITVLTMDTEQRNQILNVIASGRVVLLRNPIPDYPENNWFLALGDVTEDRPVPNQRVTIREWTLPFVRVERPTGLIEASSGRTWQDVKDTGSWDLVRTSTQDWLHVLAGDSVG